MIYVFHFIVYIFIYLCYLSLLLLLILLSHGSTVRASHMDSFVFLFSSTFFKAIPKILCLPYTISVFKYLQLIVTYFIGKYHYRQHITKQRKSKQQYLFSCSCVCTCVLLLNYQHDERVCAKHIELNYHFRAC